MHCPGLHTSLERSAAGSEQAAVHGGVRVADGAGPRPLGPRNQPAITALRRTALPACQFEPAEAAVDVALTNTGILLPLHFMLAF